MHGPSKGQRVVLTSRVLSTSTHPNVPKARLSVKPSRLSVCKAQSVLKSGHHPRVPGDCRGGCTLGQTVGCTNPRARLDTLEPTSY
eukprot:2480021-Pyramimonas_sp.AAC.1